MTEPLPTYMVLEKGQPSDVDEGLETGLDEEELKELWLAWRQSQIILMRNAETFMLQQGWISRRAVVSAASRKR